MPMTMTLITTPLTAADAAAIKITVDSLYTGFRKVGGTLTPTGSPGYSKSAIEASVSAGKRYVYTAPNGTNHYCFQPSGHVQRLFTPRNGGPSRVVTSSIGATLIEYRRG